MEDVCRVATEYVSILYKYWSVGSMEWLTKLSCRSLHDYHIPLPILYNHKTTS